MKNNFKVRFIILRKIVLYMYIYLTVFKTRSETYSISVGTVVSYIIIILVID